MQTLAQQLKIEEKKETAKRMLDDGLSISTISKYTGLPVEEIEKLMKVSN